MIRAGFLALMLVAAATASAQEPSPPLTDIAALRRQAMADPAIKAAIADTSRALESRLRDDTRMVELILKAANAKPGDHVLDIGAGGGYLALLFSTLVGKTGHVDIHNTPGWINQFPSMEVERQKTYIKQANVGWLTAPWTELIGAPGSYDLIVMGQVYHDVLLEGESPDLMNEHLVAMLKPGGRILIEDHDAIQEMDIRAQAYLHRISNGDVTGQMARAGMTLKQMILIESKHDDRRFNVFRPGVRGRTDRFIGVYEKAKN